jgi:hypothetical protein
LRLTATVLKSCKSPFERLRATGSGTI